jgi:hypothetical protein
MCVRARWQRRAACRARTTSRRSRAALADPDIRCGASRHHPRDIRRSSRYGCAARRLDDSELVLDARGRTAVARRARARAAPLRAGSVLGSTDRSGGSAGNGLARRSVGHPLVALLLRGFRTHGRNPRSRRSESSSSRLSRTWPSRPASARWTLPLAASSAARQGAEAAAALRQLAAR